MGYLQDEYGKLLFLLLKKTQHLHKGHMITATIVILMVANATNVVVIIFLLTVLDSNSLIPAAMVDVEEMVGMVMFMLEEMVTVEDSAMVPLTIAPVIAVMLTVNQWTLGSILILLIKIQPLVFLVQP